MYDFAIIGSGVSGARLAYELSAGGARCVLLEAGRAFDRHTFPPDEMGYSTAMFWGGGIEISRDGRLGLLRGKCLGGTSVVNQADLDRFDDLALDDWRQRSGIGYFTLGEMQPHYEYLAGRVASTTIPQPHWNANAHAFVRGFEARGFDWQPLHRSQTDCALDKGSDCIVCLGGCPRDSKQSALVTTIPAALALGLEIETEVEVTALVHRPDEVLIHGRRRGHDRQFRCRRAILAAGALGTTALLARSAEMRRALPALGTRFACHPQYMSFGYFDEPIDAHKGPLQSVQSSDRGLREAGLKLENVFAPPIAISMLMPGIRRRHHRAMKQYRHLACIEVAIRDEPLGTIRAGRDGRPQVDKPLSDVDRARIRRGLELVDDLLQAAGAREVIRCPQGFGLHLMGGCPIGVDPAHSVVDPQFQVHGYENLVVADSSVFPSAPGINPSLTIMALAHRAGQVLLGKSTAAAITSEQHQPHAAEARGGGTDGG